MLLEDALREYEDYFIIEKGLSKNTHVAYLNDLALFINYLNTKNISITTEITLQDIENFFLQRSKSVEPNTLGREKSSVKNFLQYCLAINVIDKDFSYALKVERKQDFFPSTLTKEEVSRLLKYLRQEKVKCEDKGNSYKAALATRNELMLKLLYALGLRVSELIDIRLNDVYPEGWCRVRGKGEKVRSVPLIDNLLIEINHYIKNARNEILTHRYSNNERGNRKINLSAQTYNNHSKPGHLLVNHHGKPISRIAVWKWVKKITVLCNIAKNIHPHTFRHTCATHLLQGGADLRVIQELVGHSNIQTTELYTHLQTDDVRISFAKYHPLYN